MNSTTPQLSATSVAASPTKMRTALFVLIAVFASILTVGCSGGDAKTEDYGGPVKDSGGTPPPPGKGGAMDPMPIDK